MTRPGWGDRLLGLLCYAGIVPVILFWRKKDPCPYSQTHVSQSQVLFAFLGGIAAIILILILALSYGMVYHRALVEPLPTEVWLLSCGRKLLIVWAVFWGYAVLRALRGSSVPIPYLSFVAGKKVLRRAGLTFLCMVWFMLAALVPLVVIAETTVTGEVDQGRVFMVYEDLNRFPRPLFSLAMYPMARASVARYGADSAVVLPLSADGIRDALTRGTVVVIASHGTEDGLLLDGEYYTPRDVPTLDGNGPLRFVYLAGCDSGAQRLAWEQALYPATVKTYDRLTPVIEHLWWLWTQGPKVVREIS